MTTITLKAQNHWNPQPIQPNVSVDCQNLRDVLQFRFDVDEPEPCFRCACTHDGDACWQDSCVEVFLKSGDVYFNFECNARGFCLAECGLSRTPRRAFSPREYAQIPRTLLVPAHTLNHRVLWQLQIQIPKSLLSHDDIILGNLYKCASNAKIPHYLCAFDVLTPTPDFHRPEFFQRIF